MCEYRASLTIMTDQRIQ